jgi:hypothetical protein
MTNDYNKSSKDTSTGKNTKLEIELKQVKELITKMTNENGRLEANMEHLK